MTATPVAPAGTDPSLSSSLADVRLRAFLPLLYVAWADGDLSADEIRGICGAADSAEGKDEDYCHALGRWLDPEQPPSATDLQALLAAIRASAAELSSAERRSLTALGVELARAGGREIKQSERAALERVEDALGVVGHEVSRRLLSPERPAPVTDQAAPSFDVGALQELLDHPNAETRQRLRALLSAKDFAYAYDLPKREYREKVLVWCRRLADEGYGSLGLPMAFGGADDAPAFLAAFETLASHDLSLLVKFGVQFGLFAGSIHQLGTEQHHRAYLEDAGSLELPGCFAMTETGHGSNVAELETVARYDRESDEFEIHTPNEEARKDYIGNAACHGRLATVFAQLEIGAESHGVHAFVVPIRDRDGNPAPGVTIEDCGDKLGLNGIDNGRLRFDRVRVPRANLLDRFAQVDDKGRYSSAIASPTKRFFTMLGTLVGGRVSVALAALTAAKSALTIAVRYAERRRQFGPGGEAETTLLDYRTHQKRLLPRLAKTYALHFALRHLAHRYLHGSEGTRRETEGLAAGLKALSTWHATDTIQACREACGGQGYLAINRFAALKADTDVLTTFEGDNTVLLQLVAKGLLSRYKKQFGDMTFIDLLRFAASQAGTTVSELNPIITRNTSAEHLRGAQFQGDALRWREDHLLSTLARRLRHRLENGTDSFRTLIECQDHVVSLAKAHTERIVFEQFRRAIDELEEPALAAVLEPLASLYALESIEQDRGWFQEHGYIEGVKAKSIRKQVNALATEIRPDARALVDAFGIPDALLAAPIAI
ncbi:MAG: acyl-CoA dehydrogenase [Acidobacteria bacterium]|nr:acyl-CoA dehydrogenase [Acidobacteriota bacterium]